MVLLQIIAADIGTDDEDLAGIHENMRGIGIGKAGTFGAADHINVQVRHDFAEIHGRKFVEVLRTPETFFFSSVPQEDDAALRPDAIGSARGISMSNAEQRRRTGAVIIGAIVDVVGAGAAR